MINKLACNPVMCLHRSRGDAKVINVSSFFSPSASIILRSGPECTFSCCHLGLQRTVLMNLSNKCMSSSSPFAIGEKDFWHERI